MIALIEVIITYARIYWQVWACDRLRAKELEEMKTYAPALLVALLAILLNSGAVSACTCAPNPPPCAEFGTLAAIFVGVVVDSAEQRTVAQNGGMTVYDVGSIRFEVREAFKGVSSKEVEIHSGTGGG